MLYFVWSIKQKLRSCLFFFFFKLSIPFFIPHKINPKTFLHERVRWSCPVCAGSFWIKYPEFQWIKQCSCKRLQQNRSPYAGGREKNACSSATLAEKRYPSSSAYAVIDRREKARLFLSHRGSSSLMSSQPRISRRKVNRFSASLGNWTTLTHRTSIRTQRIRSTFSTININVLLIVKLSHECSVCHVLHQRRLSKPTSTTKGSFTLNVKYV